MKYFICLITMINILVYIFVIGIFLWYYHISEQRKFGHVPGPKKLPVLGNMLQFQKKDSTGKQIPLVHMLTDIWKQYGGVMWVKVGLTNYIVLSSYEAIYEALVQKGGDFADRPRSYRRRFVRDDNNIGELNYTPKYQMLKNLMLASFKDYGSGREKMENIFQESLCILICDITQMEGKSINVKQQVQAAFANVIHIMIFGKHIERTQITASSIDDLLAAFFSVWDYNIAGILIDMLPVTRHLFRKTTDKLHQYASGRDTYWLQQIEQHKRNWNGEENCLLDVFLNEQARRRKIGSDVQLADDDILINCHILQIVGIVTSSPTLVGMILMCLHQPEIQEKIFREVVTVVGATGQLSVGHKNQMHYSRAVVFEVLRYLTVVPLSLLHVATKDSSIQGFFIPKGTTVMPNLWALHHDPDFWTDPWTFLPERYLDEDGVIVPPDHPNRKRLLPFGAGQRVCAAEVFALNRLFLFLVTLVQKFQFVADGERELESHDPHTWETSLELIPPSVMARFIPRQSV